MDLQDTDIYQAILDNDLKLLQKLLREQNVNQRGRDGRSYLHVAVDEGAHSDLVQALLEHVDISFRDENTDTALDVACSYGRTQLQEMVLRHVVNIVTGPDVRPLEHLLEQGWDAWPVDVDQVENIKLETVHFFQQLPEFLMKVEKVHQSIQRNTLQDFQHSLTHHKLAVTCDRTGLPPLQKATIFQRTGIVEHLVTEYPTTLNITDHTGRTALHYAACATDSYLYSLLLEAGADDSVADLHGISPAIYKDNPNIMRLQDVQRHFQVLRHKQRVNNCFNLKEIISNLNNTSESVPESFRNSSQNLYSMPTQEKTPMSKWRTLVQIIPIHSNFKGGRKSSSENFEDTALYEAVIINDSTNVKSLLGGNASANLRSLEGWSYLHLAVSHSANSDIVRTLLEHVDVSLRDADGLTALDLAVVSAAPQDIITEIQNHILQTLNSGEVTLLRRLVLKGWSSWPDNILRTDDGQRLPSKSAEFMELLPTIQKTVSCFHKAVISCDVNTIRQTLADRKSTLTPTELLESCDHTGLPPLHKAVIFQCDRVVSLLVNSYTQVIDICDHMQRTALHYGACIQDDGQMYLMLQDAGAENNIMDLWGFTPMDYKQMSHLINISSLRTHIEKISADLTPVHQLSWTNNTTQLKKMEDTRLYKAIKDDNDVEVKEAIEAGDDPTVRTPEGQSFLHIAAKVKAKLEVINALLPKVDIGLRDENGCSFVDVMSSEGQEDEAEKTAKMCIEHLVGDGNTERLKTLLLSGWDKWSVTAQEARDKSEDAGDFIDKLEELQDKVADIHKAVREGRTRDVKSLLDRKLLVQAADKTGLLPLHKAVLFENEDVVAFIIKDFPDAVNLTDNMGRTALHYAAGCPDSGGLFQKLKEAGADDTLKDIKGRNPADYQVEPHLVDRKSVHARLAHLLPGSDTQTETSELTSAQTTDQSSSAAQQTSETTSDEFHRLQTPPKSGKKQPLNLYISSDVYEKKSVPPPSTVDGKYVAYNLGRALTLALAEIAERRPWDPIEYLAHWLYKYRDNLDYSKKQEQLQKDIRTEESLLEEEELNRAKRKEEQLRLREEEEVRRKQEEEEERHHKEQEELQRKAREAALSQKPHLPTVTEEGEEDSYGKDKDESGQTELHRLAAQQGADLITLLNMGYSLADRDVNNATPRDIAEENGIIENVEALDSYVTNLLEQENMDNLQQLVVDGYDKLTDIIDQVSTDGLPEDVTDFVKALPDFKERMNNVFKAVQSGVLRDVSQSLDRKKLAMSKDKYGRSPLHVAVLQQHVDVIKHILSNFPGTVRCRDNLNRTPLHYAVAMSDELADIIREGGADPQTKDVKQRTPSYYKDEPSEILALKETIEVSDNSNQDDADETEKGETTE